MRAFAGNDWSAFVAVTLVLAGAAALAMGRALARGWRPRWQAVLYALLLAGASRFLLFALFDGRLLGVGAYLLDASVLTALALVGYQATRAHRMVMQYPWLYERAGIFSWRERASGPDG